jgi:hypothetical protein
MMYYWPDGRAPQDSDTAWGAYAAVLYAAATERRRQDENPDDTT